jgi:hypothetical protein
MTSDEWVSRVLGPRDSYTSPYKRGSYLKYKAHANELDPTFRALAEPEIPGESIANLSRTMQISATTLRTWAKKLARDRTWRPSHEAYELNHRVFTNEQEAELVSRIRSQFLEPLLLRRGLQARCDCIPSRARCSTRSTITRGWGGGFPKKLSVCLLTLFHQALSDTTRAIVKTPTFG